MVSVEGFCKVATKVLINTKIEVLNKRLRTEFLTNDEKREIREEIKNLRKMREELDR